MTPEQLDQWADTCTLKQITPEQWKAAARSAGYREARAVIYAKTLEKVALVLFICNLVLLLALRNNVLKTPKR